MTALRRVLLVASRYRLGVIAAGFALWMVVDPIWRELWESWPFFLTGLATTGIYSVAGILSGLAFGGLLAGLRLMGGVMGLLGGTIVVAAQAIPPLFIISFAYLVSPEILPFRISPPEAALAALTLIAGSYYCEALRGAIAGVERIQVETAQVSGLSRTTTFSRIVLPQALVSGVPAIGATSIVIFKLSTLLYPLGITDFFRTATLVNNRVIAPWECYALITAFYYAVGDALQHIVTRLSNRVSRKSQPTRESPKPRIVVN